VVNAEDAVPEKILTGCINDVIKFDFTVSQHQYRRGYHQTYCLLPY